MTVATSRPPEGALTRAALATPFDHARPFGVPDPLRRAVVVIGDLLAAVGVIFCVPVVILAVGIPIALCVRFLLSIIGML